MISAGRAQHTVGGDQTSRYVDDVHDVAHMMAYSNHETNENPQRKGSIDKRKNGLNSFSGARRCRGELQRLSAKQQISKSEQIAGSPKLSSGQVFSAATRFAGVAKIRISSCCLAHTHKVSALSCVHHILRTEPFWVFSTLLP